MGSIHVFLHHILCLHVGGYNMFDHAQNQYINDSGFTNKNTNWRASKNFLFENNIIVVFHIPYSVHENINKSDDPSLL